MRMPPRFVTVHRTTDAIEAEIVRDLLLDDGIAARGLGGGPARPAALFGPASEIESRIDVPADQAERAARLVAEHLDAARAALAEHDPPDDPPDDDDDDERDAHRSPGPAAERPLRHLLAAGVVGICPGGAHFYARRPVVGFTILAAQVAAFAALAAGAPGVGGAAAVVLMSLFIADLIGGQLAVRAWNRGERASRPRQTMHGLVLLGAAGVLALVCGPLLERLPGRRSRAGSDPYSPNQEMRRGIEHPSDLPFPLYLDLRR